MAQLLGHVRGCRALAEPPVIDQLLNDPDVDDRQLAAVIRSYTKSAPEGSIRLTLKLDSWHTPHAGRFSQLFPSTPMYFLYREPAAILASHRALRGSQMVPGMIRTEPLEIQTSHLSPGDLESYAEIVLEGIFRAGVKAVEAGLVIPISYDQLPEYCWEQLGPTMGIPESAWDAAKERQGFDSKRPGQQPSAPREQRPISNQDLLRHFERLETLR